MKKLRDFECQECSHTFEKFVKDQDIVECPHCGSTKTNRVFSPQAIKVNGLGVYDKKMRV